MSLLQTLKAIRSDLGELKERVGTVALQKGESLQKQRIFEFGQCTDGQSISSRRQANPPNEGDYSASHGRLRREGGKYNGGSFSGGRQTGYVDLELTGRHRRNLIVAKDSNGDMVYGFQDTKQREIAEYHESYRQKPIYKFSDFERSEIRKAAIAELKFALRQYFAR